MLVCHTRSDHSFPRQNHWARTIARTLSSPSGEWFFSGCACVCVCDCRSHSFATTLWGVRAYLCYLIQTPIFRLRTHFPLLSQKFESKCVPPLVSIHTHTHRNSHTARVRINRWKVSPALFALTHTRRRPSSHTQINPPKKTRHQKRKPETAAATSSRISFALNWH